MRLDIAYAQVLEDNARGIDRTSIAEALDQRLNRRDEQPERSTWGALPEHQQATAPLLDVAR